MATADDIHVAVLAHRLGDERWRAVRRAVWRGSALDDPGLTAAAAVVARRERRGVAWAVLALTGLGWLLLRRNARRLDAVADEPRLWELLEIGRDRP